MGIHGRKSCDDRTREEPPTPKNWRRGRESNRNGVLITRKLLILEDALHAKTATTAGVVPIFGPILGTENAVTRAGREVPKVSSEGYSTDEKCGQRSGNGD